MLERRVISKIRHFACFSLAGMFCFIGLANVKAAPAAGNPAIVQKSETGVTVDSGGAIVLARSNGVPLEIDRARLVRLPIEARTVIIGNPTVADITNIKPDLSVMTAKGVGSTNLLILDDKGAVIIETMITVDAPIEKNIVFVQRGTERESYACTPRCLPVLQLGDSNAHFSGTLTQFQLRNSAATQK